MSMILAKGSPGDGPQCPYCKEWHYVKWNNEYGDPQPGIFRENCLYCCKEFTIEVSIEYNTY